MRLLGGLGAAIKQRWKGAHASQRFPRSQLFTSLKLWRSPPTTARSNVLDVFVADQLAGNPVQDHAAVFSDVAVVGALERHMGVLLGHQNGKFSPVCRLLTR